MEGNSTSTKYLILSFTCTSISKSKRKSMATNYNNVLKLKILEGD